MSNRYVYAGFWLRTLASLIDTILLTIVISPLMIAYYGWDAYMRSAVQGGSLGVVQVLLSWVFPLVVTVLFWHRLQATPGKMLLSLKVLDEKTGQTISWKQSLIRYVGYFISTFGLLLGFVWVAFDAKKQGWHDKLAGTVVVRDLKPGQD